MGLEAVVSVAHVAALAEPPFSLCLYPLATAIGKTCKAYKKAKGNKIEAAMLAERAQVSPPRERETAPCTNREHTRTPHPTARRTAAPS